MFNLKSEFRPCWFHWFSKCGVKSTPKLTGNMRNTKAIVRCSRYGRAKFFYIGVYNKYASWAWKHYPYAIGNLNLHRYIDTLVLVISLGIRHLNTSPEPEQHSAKVFRQLMVYTTLPSRISKLGNVPSFSWFKKTHIAFQQVTFLIAAIKSLHYEWFLVESVPFK